MTFRNIGFKTFEEIDVQPLFRIIMLIRDKKMKITRKKPSK